MIYSAELEIRRRTRITTIPQRFNISALSENGDCLAARCVLIVRGLPILIPDELYSSRWDLIRARSTFESLMFLMVNFCAGCFFPSRKRTSFYS
jgi:hypothetical protein